MTRPSKWYYDDARRLALAGMRRYLIARELGISAGQVAAALECVPGVHRGPVREFDRDLAHRLRHVEGRPLVEVAAALGVTSAAICRAVGPLGKSLWPPGPKRRFDRDEAGRLRHVEGRTLREIAGGMGVSQSTICRSVGTLSRS